MIGFEITIGSDFDLIRIYNDNIFIEQIRLKMVVNENKEKYLKSINYYERSDNTEN